MLIYCYILPKVVTFIIGSAEIFTIVSCLSISEDKNHCYRRIIRYQDKQLKWNLKYNIRRSI